MPRFSAGSSTAGSLTWNSSSRSTPPPPARSNWAARKRAVPACGSSAPLGTSGAIVLRPASSCTFTPMVCEAGMPALAAGARSIVHSCPALGTGRPDGSNTTARNWLAPVSGSGSCSSAGASSPTRPLLQPSALSTCTAMPSGPARAGDAQLGGRAGGARVVVVADRRSQRRPRRGAQRLGGAGRPGPVPAVAVDGGAHGHRGHRVDPRRVLDRRCPAPRRSRARSSGILVGPPISTTRLISRGRVAGILDDLARQLDRCGRRRLRPARPAGRG